jgi:hypothetical protein
VWVVGFNGVNFPVLFYVKSFYFDGRAVRGGE